MHWAHFLRIQWLAAIMIALVTCVFIGGLSLSGRVFPGTIISEAFLTANRGWQDFLASNFSPNTQPDPRIHIVTIDDRTLNDRDGLGRWQDFRWQYYADVVKNLSDAGAGVIALDILFPEKKDDEGENLANALRLSNRSVLAFQWDVAHQEHQPLFPLTSLISASHQVGYVDMPTLAGQPTIHALLPSISLSGIAYEAFSFATLRAYFDLQKNQKTFPSANAFSIKQGLYKFPYVSEGIPTLSSGEPFIGINFLRNQTAWAAYRQTSFLDVYNRTFSPESFRDDIVLIGATATALGDRVLTAHGQMPGVFVHASMIDTILDGIFVTRFSLVGELITIVLIALFFSVLLLYIRSRIWQVISLFLGVIGAFVFHGGFFALFHTYFAYSIELFAIMITTAMAVSAYRYLYEERDTRRLKSALGQYLAGDIVDRVLAGHGEIALGWVRREITTFFSDIQWFTTHSESLAPERVVEFLSVYLQKVSDVIIAHGGFVNKYQWDAVMALWWAFEHDENQSIHACQSALLQQRAITELNPIMLEKFGFSLRVRMGISRGAAVVGNIGSAGKKIEFTAIGDSVNIASRIEAINKIYGTLICASESVMRSTSDQFIWRELDLVRAKWKSETTRLYELIDTIESNKKDILQQQIILFSEWLEAYRQQQWWLSKSKFVLCIEKYGDTPSRTFLDRIQYFETHSPAYDWDGSFDILHK